MDRRHPNVANLDEVPADQGPSAGVFAANLRGMSRQTGGSKLGCTYTEVEPGRVAWPFHWHANNEEALIVVAGTGTLRLGDLTIPIRAGDYVTLACGVSHQLQNTGTEVLRYWCTSTRLDPEIVGYPDSNKVGASTQHGPNATFRQLFAAGAGLGYFDGDPLAAPGAKVGSVILVGQYDSPYVRRVAVSLHLLGLPFARDTRSVFADADAMRRINPLGRIPSLVLDDGEVLIDSAAILDHLDETVGPERALLPPRGASRRRALRIVALASGTLDKAGAIVYERTLRPEDKRFPAWIERCRVQLDSGLAALEAEVVGWDARPLQPNVTLGCVLGYLRHRAPETFPSGGFPALERHLAACDALDAFARTRPADDERMPDGLGDQPSIQRIDRRSQD